MRTCLVTGCAGFIGYHTAKALLSRGDAVVGVDSIDAYYSVALKRARLNELHSDAHGGGFAFHELDIVNEDALSALFSERNIDEVIHLAAQAGTRNSINNPRVYIDSNVGGFLSILECCRRFRVRHLVYASSSSVYGMTDTKSFSEEQRVDSPVSLYAATKRADELMAYAYSDLYGIPLTGLRFFNAYGPWGRPDMAYYKFTRRIVSGLPIDVYNYGRMRRDFTYIDDIVEGMLRVLELPPQASPPARILNIGNNMPVSLLDMIGILEDLLGQKAALNLLPMQPGDVVETCADISKIEELTGFAPSTCLRWGLEQFVGWYMAYGGDSVYS